VRLDNHYLLAVRFTFIFVRPTSVAYSFTHTILRLYSFLPYCDFPRDIRCLRCLTSWASEEYIVVRMRTNPFFQNWDYKTTTN